MAVISLDDLEKQVAPAAPSSVISLDDLEKQATPSSSVVSLDDLEKQTAPKQGILSALLENIARPGAALRNSLIHDMTAAFTPGATIGGDGSDNALAQGWSNPRSVPSVASAIPVQPGASEAQLWGNAALGTVADIGYDPINLVPLPVGKAIGAGITHLAEKGVPWAVKTAEAMAKHIPSLTPNVTQGVKERNLLEQMALEAEQAKANPAPSTTPQYFDPEAGPSAPVVEKPAPNYMYRDPEQGYPGASGAQPIPVQPKRSVPVAKQPEVQVVPQFKDANDPALLDYLAQYIGPDAAARMPADKRLMVGNASPSQLRDFVAGFKSAAPVEAPASAPNIIEQAVAKPVPSVPRGPVTPFTPAAQGQLVMKDQGKNVRQFPNLERPQPVYDQSIGPARDQGQAQFDFTKMPEPAPVVQPKLNVMEKAASRDTVAALRQKLKDPNLSDAEFEAVQRQIAEMVAPDKSAGIIQEPAKPVAPVKLTPKEKMKADLLAGQVAEFKRLSNKGELSADESIRFDELAKSISKLKKELPSESIIKTLGAPKPAAQPSMMDDLKDFITGWEPEGGLHSAIPGMPGPMKQTAAGKSASERLMTVHREALAKHIKDAGGDVASYVESLNLPPEQAKLITSRLSKAYIGNMNLSKYPDEQQKQMQELFNGQEEKLKTTPITHEQIKTKAKELSSFPVTEAVSRNAEGQQAAEYVRKRMVLAAKYKAIAEDTTLSAQDVVKKILQLETADVKKIGTEAARTMSAGNIPVETHEQTLETLRKLVDRLREDPTLSKGSSRALIAEIRKVHPDLKDSVTGADIFKYLFRNSLTSGPLTLLANATSGAGAIAARPAMRALEVTAAKIRSAMSGEPTSATYKEVGAMIKGIQQSLKKEQLPDVLAAKTMSDKYRPSPLATLAASAKTKTGQKVLDTADAVIGYPERYMKKTDDAVKNTLGLMEKYAASARGEDVLADQHVVQRILSAQSRLTFQDEMSMVGQAVNRFRSDYSKGNPTIRRQAFDIATYSLQPFIQTVDRIIVGGINLSGLGTAKTIAKTITGRYPGAFGKGFKADKVMGENFDRDMAAAMIGAPLFIWSGVQLAQGNITGGAPEDAGAREAFSTSGKTEYSIKQNGRWVPIRVLPEPFATALQINLATHQALSEYKNTGNFAEDAGTTAFKIASKVGYMLGTKQYLSGMNSLLSTISNKSADSVNELPVVKKVSGALVPSVVKDVAVVKDTLENRPRVMADTAVENIKRRAGASKGMVPELNTFGEEVTHDMQGKVRTGKVYDLLEKFPPDPVPRTRDGVKLSQQEYYDLKKNVGTQRKAVYTLLANSDTFMKAPKGVQQIITEKLVNKADEIGSFPQKIKEIQKDPLYYNRELRILLEIDKPGGERHFPYLK